MVHRAGFALPTVLDRFRNARTGAAQAAILLFRATKPAVPEQPG